MALRIRRGTEAQLQLTTPVEGELIYTTDSKDLFVGDGTTLGGIKVGGDIPASINDLTDVNIAGIAVGQVLKWNGSAFVPGNDDTTVGTGSGVVEGTNYRINIVADDSTTLVDVNNRYISGLIIGDLYDEISQTVVVDPNSRLSKLDIITDSGTLVFQHNTSNLYSPLGELIIDGNSKTFFGNISINSITADLKGSVFADDSSLIIDSVNNKIFGNVYGDVYNNLTDQLIIDTFVQEAALDIVTDTGDLILDRITGNFFNPNGDLLIDGIANSFFGTVQGTLVGNVVGDVVGSVFGDDSTLIINAVNNSISVNLANINLLSYTDTGSGFDGLRVVASDQNEAELRLNRENILPNGSQESVGVLYFDTLGTDGFESTVAYIQSFGSEDPGDNYAKAFLELSVINENGNVTQDNSLVLTWDGKTGFGTSNPTQKLDVRGNGIFSGEVQAAAFKGSLMADDSTTLVDATNGVITAQHIQFGSYSSVQRPSGINGMVIYNSTVNRFQGFQNGSWINLDDGTSA
jgi:hypothetical protein